MVVYYSLLLNGSNIVETAPIPIVNLESGNIFQDSDIL